MANQMAPNLATLLARTATDFKAPVALPAGTWNAVIGQPEFGESKQKKTPFVSYPVLYTGPGDDIDPASIEGFDLGERKGAKVFYLTEDSTYRLTEFVASLGHDVAGLSLNEIIPLPVGTAVLVNVTRRHATDGSSTVFNDVNAIVLA